MKNATTRVGKKNTPPKTACFAHAPWSIDQWTFVLKHAGLHNRKWIAKKSGRSNTLSFHSVKERMQKVGGGTTKYLNGMPLKWAEYLWPHRNDLRALAFKSKAGPTGERGNFRFVLIPWVQAESIALKEKTPIEIKRCIRAMATYQRFVFGKKSRMLITKEINKILRRRS